MPASPAQIEANRRNSLRSTGPRTVEGKEQSRRNALKHGLTGAGVAVHGEDAAEIDRRMGAYESEFRPNGEFARMLVHRVALLSVRLERCARNEAAALSERVRGAVATFDESRKAEVDRLMRDIAENPAAHCRALRRMPEGIDRMLAAWEALRSDLTRGPGSLWDGIHRQIADELSGRHADAATMSPFRAMSEAFWDSYNAMLKPGEGSEIADVTARREFARDRLLEAVDREIAGLHAARANLDLESLALDRAGAADRALFDPSKDAILARKYEAAAERGLFRAVAQIAEANALPGAPGYLELIADPGSAEAAEERRRGSLASFFRDRAGEGSGLDAGPEFAEDRASGAAPAVEGGSRSRVGEGRGPDRAGNGPAGADR